MSVADEPLRQAEGEPWQEGGAPTVPTERKTWEPTPYIVKLEASTDIPSLVPELFRQMYELGQAHGLETPHEITCKVQVVYKGKVSKKAIGQLLKDAEANMYGLDIICYEGHEDD